MTAQSRRHHDRKAGPAGSPRHATQQVPPGDDSAAAAAVPVRTRPAAASPTPSARLPA
jgi:hypothetical protein